MLKARALRRRKRQKTNPKRTLTGRKRPANENFEVTCGELMGEEFMADEPPLNGLLVSMVSCTLAEP